MKPTMKTTFSDLPSLLIGYIFEFCDVADLPKLRRVCNKFNSLIEKSYLFPEQLIQRFMLKKESDDCMIFQFDSAKISEVNLSKINNAKEMWYKLCEINGKSKEIFAYYEEEEANFRSFSQYFWDNLKNPKIPMPKLKRDIYCFNTNTKYQNFLTEVYFNLDTEFELNSRRRDKPVSNILNRLISKTQEPHSKIFSQQKEKIFNSRWYKDNAVIIKMNVIKKVQKLKDILNSNSKKIKKGVKKFCAIDRATTSRKHFLINSKNQKTLKNSNSFKNKNFKFSISDSTTTASSESEAEIRIVNEKAYTILDLFDFFCDSIRLHCKMTYQYLNSLSNPILLLKEYINRWEIYVMSMLELETNFKSFIISINTLYNTYYEDNFSGPKFSFWRLMSKIWLQEIFKNLKERIFYDFRSIFFQYRIRQNNDIQNSEEIESLGFQFNTELTPGIPQNCYNDMDDISGILRHFLKTIQDISTNEIDAFWMENYLNTKSSAYNELIKLLENDTKILYNLLWENLPEYSTNFIKFLKFDSVLLEDIGDQKLSYCIMKIQNEVIQYKGKCLILNELDQIILNEKAIYDHNIQIDENLIGFIQELVFLDKKEYLDKMNFNRQSYHKIAGYILQNHPGILDYTNSYQENIFELDRIKRNDDEIIYMLKGKNILVNDINKDQISSCLLSLDKDMDFPTREKINILFKHQNNHYYCI